MDQRFRLRGRHGDFDLVPEHARVPLHTRADALDFLRGFGADPDTRAALRQQLVRFRPDVARLSDEQVLEELATALATERFSALRTHRDRTTRPAPRRRAEPVPMPEPKAEPAPPPRDEETFVLAVEVTTIGGTPLLRHPVRILDPDTGAVVVDDLQTDDDGVVRALVPEDKTYRIEILDEDWEPPAQLHEDADPGAVLACRFVDAHGLPIEGLEVEVRHGDAATTLVTDAAGWIESPAGLGVYELRVGDETFVAHAILPEDLPDALTRDLDADGARDDEAIRYEFVVATEPADDGADDDAEEEEHRLERDATWADLAEALAGEPGGNDLEGAMA